MPIDDAHIGEDTQIWHPELVNIYGCTIGRRCNIAAFVEIGLRVVIGDDCQIGAFTFIPTGVYIGDNVFIGPQVSFVNDNYPPTPKGEWTIRPTVVEDGASIGTGARILSGIRIGAGALIGAGAVVTKDVEAGTTVVGVPAEISEAKDG